MPSDSNGELGKTLKDGVLIANINALWTGRPEDDDSSRIPLPQLADGCTGCGSCCENMVHPPDSLFAGLDHFGPAEQLRAHVDGAELSLWGLSLPEDLRLDIIARMAAVVSGVVGSEEPCHWYDAKAKRCLNYEHRPPVCRDFPVDGPGCRYFRRLAIVAAGG